MVYSRTPHQRLRVSDNGRFLIHEDGSPFFYLGDTAWELIHALRREEVDHYLKTRAAQRFTVVQTVVLSEFDGLSQPNAYGHVPFQRDADGYYDPDRPDVRPGDEDYWDHVDYVIDAAGDNGLYVGLLPTWGDKVLQLWGKGPTVFAPYYRGQSRAAATGKAYRYGRFLGERYRNRANVIWVLGGDRPADAYEGIWRAMARGIAEGVNGTEDYANILMTYHPYDVQPSSALLHHDPWLQFNMNDSGHRARDIANYELITNDYHKRPAKPTIDAEARYEDNPVNQDVHNGRFDEYDVRQAAYWAVFAGAAGHTYGHYSVFQFYAPASRPTWFGHAQDYWYDALRAPGAEDMAHLRALIESRPYLARIPDQALILEGQAAGADHVRATRAADGGFAFVYIPTGRPVTLDLSRLAGAEVQGGWYDPREGLSTPIGRYSTTEPRTFTPPTSGRGNDWVLVLDGT